MRIDTIEIISMTVRNIHVLFTAVSMATTWTTLAKNYKLLHEMGGTTNYTMFFFTYVIEFVLFLAVLENSVMPMG